MGFLKKIFGEKENQQDNDTGDLIILTKEEKAQIKKEGYIMTDNEESVLMATPEYLIRQNIPKKLWNNSYHTLNGKPTLVRVINQRL
jgi:hypothetical protein